MATADDVFIRQFLIILACMIVYAVGAAILGRGIAADAEATQAAGEAATIERIKPAGQPNVAPAPAAPAAKDSGMASKAAAATKETASDAMAKAKDMTEKAMDATKSAADSAMRSASGAMASAKAAASDF